MIIMHILDIYFFRYRIIISTYQTVSKQIKKGGIKIFNQFEELKSFFLSLNELFNNPQIRALGDEDFEEFKRIAPDVLKRMEKSEIPAS